MSLLPSSLSAAFHAVRQYVTPTLKSTQFLEKGQLTPEEFVLAGDYLTRMSPSWTWCRGDPSKAKPYLPPDKQYLMTKGVPCPRRVRALQSATSEKDKDVSGADGWVEPATSLSGSTVGGSGKKDDEDADADLELVGFAACGDHSAAAVAAAPSAAPEDADEDDEYGDLSSFMDKSLLVHDTASLGAAAAQAAEHGASTGGSGRAAQDAEMRVYELSVCYDNFYRTPRVYLKGFSESGVPLGPDAMLEDVMQDYVSKTATLEHHPHLGAAAGAEGGGAGGQYISIHPCRHAQAMKRIVDSMMASAASSALGSAASAPTAGSASASSAVASGASGSASSFGSDAAAMGAGSGAGATGAGAPAGAPSIELYLFIFLKFVGSMVPTMAYDNTLAVSVSGGDSSGGGGSAR